MLSAVGGVVYEWDIASDRMRWGANALGVLGLESFDQIATGRAVAALVDPDNLGNRQAAIVNATAADQGSGVSYEIQYALLPDRSQDGRQLWIEDTGRWYAGESGRPARAHGVLRVINERYQREQRLAFLSRYDELTGYYNRPHLLTRLGDALLEAKRLGTSIAFLVVAIDNFRTINEAYGFEVADEVFAAVARRLKGRLREADVIGRFSDNKFGIVLTDCDEEDLQTATERFHKAVRQDVITTEASSVAVTISTGGVALPRHGRSVSEAMVHAQEALHLARQHGDDHFVGYVHSPQRQARRRSNAALSSDLVSALNERRLKLAFQPIVDIQTRLPAFHEVLLRLEQPDGTIMSAGEFIGASERLGLIRLIDRFVLKSVIEAALADPGLHLSLNVSAETVGDSEWLSILAAEAARNPDLPAQLIIEITESAAIRHLDDATRFIAAARGLGCRIAIDDFGAGYSSFRNLRELAVDLVKIDGAFVERLAHSKDDQTFVRALVDLARNFEIGVVAEWVQDEETTAILAAWGAHYLQGHLTGKPSLERPRSAAAA